MVDNEIIKALNEADGLNEVGIYCADCEGKYIAIVKVRDVIDLINRQNAEIERLESNLKFVRGTVKRALSENERLQKESKEQFKNWEILDERTKQRYAELYEEAKEVVRAEAIKEFAEKVKDWAYTKARNDRQLFDWYDEIDDLVKEMEQGNES